MNKKIRNFALVGVALLSMFACKPDREFNAGFTSIYVLQQNKTINGEDVPHFAPYFTVSANRTLLSYEVKSYITDINTGVSDTTYYPLQWQSSNNRGEYNFYSPVNLEKYPWVTDPTKISSGPYILTVKDANGSTFQNRIDINGLKMDSILGKVNIVSARYVPGTHLKVTIEPVTRATGYLFSIAPYDQPNYRELMYADPLSSGKYIDLATNRINSYDDNQKFVFRVVASNGNGLLRESSPIVITMGKEGAEYEADIKD